MRRGVLAPPAKATQRASSAREFVGVGHGIRSLAFCRLGRLAHVCRKVFANVTRGIPEPGSVMNALPAARAGSAPQEVHPVDHVGDEYGDCPYRGVRRVDFTKAAHRDLRA
jgi:hypothetical protein